MNDVAVDPPGTLYGQLQRGRGSAARKAVVTPGAGDLVYDCIRRDPRWDHLIESRGLYYARLIIDLELPVRPLADHLFAPVDQIDDDEWRTSLTLNVLADLVRLSRRDAAEPLRRYAGEGWNWYEALDVMVALGDLDLASGLDEVAVSRCDDDDLLGLVLNDVPLIEIWAARHRRIAEALELRKARQAAVRQRRRRAIPADRSDADLLRQARGLTTTGDSPGSAGSADDVAERGLTAIIELGRRRSPLLLDLAEELLPVRPHRCRGVVFRALRDLGPIAVPRARIWAADDRGHSHVGIGILARHGTEQDIPALLAALRQALADQDWAAAARPVEGLGRLHARAAVPLLRATWPATGYSYLRPRLLAAIHAGDPEAVRPYAREALWDCEEQARRCAAGLAPMEAETALRLRRLRGDTAEEAAVRAAAARRLR